MTPGKKQAFEPTGLIPRSIVRTFERFYKQLLPKTKYSAIREYRISRYQVLVSIRCLCTLLILPLVTRVITNWLIFSYALPQIKYFWDVTYQDEHVFSEIDQFSQVLFFDSLLDTAPSHVISSLPNTRSIGTSNVFPVQNDGKKVLLLTYPFKKADKNYKNHQVSNNSFYLPNSLASPQAKVSKDSFWSKPAVLTPFCIGTPWSMHSTACEEIFTMKASTPFFLHSTKGLSYATRKLPESTECLSYAMELDKHSIFSNFENRVQKNFRDEASYLDLTQTKPLPSESKYTNLKSMRDMALAKEKKYSNFISKDKNNGIFCLASYPQDNSASFISRNFLETEDESKANQETSLNQVRAKLIRKDLRSMSLVDDPYLLPYGIVKAQSFDEQQISWRLSNATKCTTAPFGETKENEKFFNLDLLSSTNISSDEAAHDIPFFLTNTSSDQKGMKKDYQEKYLEMAQNGNKNVQDQVLQNKIFELAESSHFHALQSVTNVFADLSSILVLIFLLITLKPEITILKSFLVEVIYNLSDTTKSFLLILMTDLLVGFHSPRGWETLFSLILHHFGLPENQDFVFLFVATLPVILDTVFKYWIFRHLNKISPSTVATYHNMIE